jgi:ribosomal protein L37E
MWTRALWVSRPAAAAKDCASCGAGRGMQRGTAEWGKEVSSRSRMVSC